MKILVPLLLLFLSLRVQAQEFVEPNTGVAFPETMKVDETDLQFAGAGVRTKLVVKVYAGALYLATSVKNDLAKFRDAVQKPDQSVFDALLKSSAGKMFVLHFVRDVDGRRIQDGFKDGLKKSLDLEDPSIKVDLDSFLRSVGANVRQGDVLRVYLQQAEIRILKPDGSAETIHNEKLASAIAAHWLGRKPVSEELKNAMVSRLSNFL
jgi:hypothetical protein